MTLVTTTNLTDRCYKGRDGYPPSLIGIHTMEAPEAGQTAENVANYFKTIDASSHWCVDNNSRVRVVRDEDGAWTMPPTNRWSLNIEMAGYAGQTSVQWADAYSLATLDNVAVCAAEWCRKYAIPVRRLTYNQIAGHYKGFAGHIDVNNVFHGSNHTDPGAAFPWPHFLSLVNGHLNNIPVPQPSGKPNCTAFQLAVHTAADNMWGVNTDKNATAMIEATDFGGHQFPYGVRFAQEAVGVVADGYWGPNSKAALTRTVTAAQNALKGMGFDPQGVDGIWGPNTDKAYQAARKACHI